MQTATPVAANSGYTCVRRQRRVSYYTSRKQRRVEQTSGWSDLGAELTSGLTHLLAIGVAGRITKMAELIAIFGKSIT